MKFNFIENLKILSNEYEVSLDSNFRKYNGIYYTGIDLAIKIVEELMKKNTVTDIWNLKFLEPAVGVGNFVFAYLYFISKNYKLTQEQVKILYSNIYVCDSDDKALKIFRSKFIESSEHLFGIELDDNFIPNIGGAVIYDLDSKKLYTSIEKYFGKQKYDVIITNPPYKSLRAEKRHYSTKDEYELDRKNYEEIKIDIKERYKLSGASNANIYKYFVEEILLNYSHEKSCIGLLIPASILKDKSCVSLREYLINNTNLFQVTSLEENNKYLKANQALSYLLIEKGENKTGEVLVTRMEKEEIKLITTVDEINKREGKEIIILSEEENKLLQKMEAVPKLKELDSIKVLRGELDLTIYKKFISEKKTKFPLLRGRNIAYYKLENLDEIDYVTEDFLDIENKKEAIYSDRIACQQIANMSKKKRLVFTRVEKGYVLGNSCNYIIVDENPYGIDLDYLMGIFNSDVYDWYFKLFSSNNHINNYELENMPIPVDCPQFIDEVIKLSNQLKFDSSNLIKEKLDKTILNYFNGNKECESNNKNESMNELSFDKFEEDFNKFFKEKKEKLETGELLNDFKYKLSNLDIEIIESVPEGGNWKNIPQNIMNKSKRLLGIQKTGGRTTLYGRLEYLKPSYTITTYFNRPGNGCNIHPNKNRVLTTREAARLQSFPDDYYFVGNQRDILNQIGNAVPPIIGYLFGNGIKQKLGINNSIDLFSGAGGLTYGMKLAGIHPVIANDIDYSACLTLKVNNPEIDVLCDDITKESVKRKIINKGKKLNVGLICGGPPCQGFSLAGFRKSDDPRNQLFREFLEIVESVMPKAFVFENVTGLLSFNKGRTFKEIKQLFQEVGYDVHAEKINFAEYGVPQRRVRVILLGIRSDLNVHPKELFPKPNTINEENQVIVLEAIGEFDEKVQLKEQQRIYGKLMKKEVKINEYFDFLAEKTNDREPIQLSIF